MKKKLQYLFDYYKLPMVSAAILLYILIFAVYRHETKKTPCLYVGLVNVAAGEELQNLLTDAFLEERAPEGEKEPVLLYQGLYLTDDTSSPDYTYSRASQMKILASIDANQLDIVILNREAFDAFAQNGFLFNLEQLLAEEPKLAAAVSADLVENMEILEDNAKEVALDESVEYHSETVRYPMGLDVAHSPLFENAGFTEPIYLAVLANTERTDMVKRYLAWIYQTV